MTISMYHENDCMLGLVGSHLGIEYSSVGFGLYIGSNNLKLIRVEHSYEVVFKLVSR